MSKIETQARPYIKNTPRSTDKLIRRRDKQENNRQDRSADRLIALGLVVLTLAGVGKAVQIAGEPKSHTVIEQVRAFDNPTSVVERAENQFGKDPGDFSVPKEADAVANHYGTLQPGEKIAVSVK